MNNKYVVSTSHDQTTRVFAEWKRQGKVTWHEISRPQIHGYDINCVAYLPHYDEKTGKIAENVNGKIVSGADEKVVRVFEAPYSFVKTLNSLSDSNVRFSEKETNEEAEKNYSKQKEATKQPLGLMNKPVKKAKKADENTKTAGDDEDGLGGIESFDPNKYLTQKIEMAETVISTDCPPYEDYLLGNTLWPETHKLYGHAYEIFSLAVNHKGMLYVSNIQERTLPVLAFQEHKVLNMEPSLYGMQ